MTIESILSIKSTISACIAIALLVGSGQSAVQGTPSQQPAAVVLPPNSQDPLENPFTFEQSYAFAVTVASTIDPNGRVLIDRLTRTKFVVLTDAVAEALVLDVVSSTAELRTLANVVFDPDELQLRLPDVPAPATHYSCDTTETLVDCNVDGLHIGLITRPVLVGEVTSAEVYRLGYRLATVEDAYRPMESEIRKLNAITADTEIRLYFGTWQAPSMRLLPLLMRVLGDVNNPRISYRLIAVDRRRREPKELIREVELINVPRVIVFQDGEELGRFSPSNDQVELDLINVLFSQ